MIRYRCILLIIALMTSTTACEMNSGNEPDIRRTDSPPLKPDTPIMGYRFQIEGDFNGDGHRDTLIEHFIDSVSRQETHKYTANTDYGKLGQRIWNERPIGFISSSSPSIDTIWLDDTGMHFGLSFLRNEGDLDGNGTDELSYVMAFTDESTLNGAHVLAYEPDGWRNVLSFRIREWDLPAVPCRRVMSGSDKHADRIHALEDSLRSFSFIEKIRPGVLRIRMVEMEETDSTAGGETVTRVVRLSDSVQGSR